MALNSPVWTEDQSLTFDDTTPAKTVEGKADLDIAEEGFFDVVIQVTVTFGANADGNATIKLYGSADSGTTVDTEPFYTRIVTYTASATKRIPILVSRKPWVRVGVTNGNAYTEDITISAKYAGMQVQTAA